MLRTFRALPDTQRQEEFELAMYTATEHKNDMIVAAYNFCQQNNLRQQPIGTIPLSTETEFHDCSYLRRLQQEGIAPKGHGHVANIAMGRRQLCVLSS